MTIQTKGTIVPLFEIGYRTADAIDSFASPTLSDPISRAVQRAVRARMHLFFLLSFPSFASPGKHEQSKCIVLGTNGLGWTLLFQKASITRQASFGRRHVETSSSSSERNRTSQRAEKQKKNAFVFFEARARLYDTNRILFFFTTPFSCSSKKKKTGREKKRILLGSPFHTPRSKP